MPEYGTKSIHPIRKNRLRRLTSGELANICMAPMLAVIINQVYLLRDRKICQHVRNKEI
jgi:hypothetical protein